MSILRGLLSAREGSYFKSEQEDDPSAYRRRRIREGAIKEHDVGRLLEGPTELFPISDTKLAEIHAQEARVSAPMRGMRLRVGSQMPPMSTKGGHGRDRSIAGTYRVPSARGAVWGARRGAGVARGEQRERCCRGVGGVRKTKAVADKALVAGTRALFYGSLLAGAGVVGGGMLAATVLDIRDADEALRALPPPAPRWTQPGSACARKAWLESRGLSVGGGEAGEESAARWIEDSTIVRDLRRKFRMRRGGE